MYKFIILLLAVSAATVDGHRTETCALCKDLTAYFKFFGPWNYNIVRICRTMKLDQEFCLELPKIRWVLGVNDDTFCDTFSFCQDTSIKNLSNNPCIFKYIHQCADVIEKFQDTGKDFDKIDSYACRSSLSGPGTSCWKYCSAGYNATYRRIVEFLGDRQRMDTLCEDITCPKEESVLYPPDDDDGPPPMRKSVDFLFRNNLSSSSSIEWLNDDRTQSVADFSEEFNLEELFKLMKTLWNIIFFDRGDRPNLNESKLRPQHLGSYSPILRISSLIPSCIRCQSLFHFVRDALKDSSTVKIVKDFIRLEACTKFPFPTICMSFVNQNLDKYLKEIFVEQEPLATCVDLKLCKRLSRKVDISRFGDYH